MPYEVPPTAGMPLYLSELFRSFFTAESFESVLAKYLGVQEVDIYSSGTLCLSLAFETVKKITGRSRVIVPAYTCPLLAIAAHAAGVELVLCDTELNSCNFDTAVLQQICDKTIAAVVPTDLAGLPVDVSSVKEIAKSSGSYVIEDAAQALGAKRNGLPVGVDADFAVYSLAVGKGLSLYDGGIICAANEELRTELRQIARARIKSKMLLNAQRIVELIGLTFFYNPAWLSFFYGRDLRRCIDKGDLVRAVGEYFDFEIPSYQFDSFRKNVGANLLSRLPAFVQANRTQALRRIEQLKQLSCLRVLEEVPGSEGSWPFFMLLAESESQRDAIMNILWKSGLGVTRLFIHQLGDYDYLRKIVPQQCMPNAADFAARSFSVSNSHWLDDERFQQVLAGIKNGSRAQKICGNDGRAAQPNSIVSCL